MIHPAAWVGVQGISQAVAGSLLAAVWQGILLTAAAWLGLRLLPKTPAAIRFAIWFGVFLLVASLPVIALWPRYSRVAQPGGRGAWLTLDSHWSLAIGAVWAIASLARALTLVVAGFRVRALWKRAEPVQIDDPNPAHREAASANIATYPTSTSPGTVISTEVQRSGETCNSTSTNLPASIFGGARHAEVCVSDEVDRPSVIGFFAPKILIPRWLLERLTPAELKQIVLHEAGHLRRADDWMNLLQKLALVVFPLNPALAWIERRLCFERELACDERVLRDSAEEAGASTAYAACLVALAEYRMGRRGLTLNQTPGLALGFWGTLGRESELAQRVGRILAGGGKMKPGHARLLLGGAILALVVVAAKLPQCPQIVGFTSNSSSAAYTIASQLSDRSPDQMAGFRAQSVVFRPGIGSSVLGQQSAHRDDDRTNGAQSGAGRTVAIHRVVAQAHVSEARHGAPGLAADQAGAGNWVLVTTWDGSASRVVMTPAERVYEQRVYRYAAVPVRGGWLVIQL
jgi:hypothetical protein